MLRGSHCYLSVLILLFVLLGGWVTSGCTTTAALQEDALYIPIETATTAITINRTIDQPVLPTTLNLLKTPTPLSQPTAGFVPAVVTAVVVVAPEPTPIPSAALPIWVNNTSVNMAASPSPVTPSAETLFSLSPAAHVTQPGYANKVGFHVGPDGAARGLGEWMRLLDQAHIPVFLKSVDAAGPLYEAQELARVSGVDHTLVYRRSGGVYELPDYSLNPAQAARDHWARHVAVWPPELDPAFVWMETINEPDASRSEWLALFALETARLAVRDGRRWAAFGWATGEPEPDHWQNPAMLSFLRYAGDHPDLIAIALHEYSLTPEAIDVDYPFLVGRFQWLYLICDQQNIPRPTVLITEWGWAYQTVPGVHDALNHIAWANNLYGRFPQVKGAAIWYLGGGWGEIGNQVQSLIAPMTTTSLEPMDVGTSEIAPDLFAKYYLDRGLELPTGDLP